MAKTLQQILGYENLTGVVEDPKGGIPERVLPPGFTSIRRSCEGNTAKWLAFKGTRKTSRLLQYGAASRRRDMAGIIERTAVMIHSFEHTFQMSAC